MKTKKYLKNWIVNLLLIIEFIFLISVIILFFDRLFI